MSDNPIPFTELLKLEAEHTGPMTEPGAAERQRMLTGRLFKVAPCLDMLLTACENLENDSDNARLHEAITIAPELRAILDGKQ